MKKYLSSFLLLTAIIAIALSFRTGTGKYGPHLSYLLNNSSQNTFIVYVYLNDKGPDAQQKLSNPLNLVTQRSIERRLKVKSPENVVDLTDVPIFEEYVSQINSKALNVRNQIKWLNAVSVECSRTQLDELASLNFVKQIEIVETYRKVKEEPTDKNNNNSVVIDHPDVDSMNYGTAGLSQITQIKVNLVHNQGIYGQGVLIASLDDGFRNQTHPCFTNPLNPINILSQYDFQLHLPGAYRTNNSHGTTTISCIGAYAPGSLIGVSFKSKFLVARTEVDSFERNIEMDNWIAASQWADSLGADVITSSLGYNDFDAGQISYTWQQMNGNTVPVTIGGDLAVNKGITVFNSAGNAGYVSPTQNTLGAPADGDSVITIGAVGPSGTRSSFSSCGPTTDNPPRIKPDVLAQGSSVQTANGSGTGYSGFSSGTSYSCPIAAGVGALILSANKNLTPMQVRGILRKFANNTSNPNNQLGWGIIDAQQSVDSARKLDNTAPVITHVQPFTTTTSTVPVLVKTKITDNGIIRTWTNESPRCWFRKSTNNGINWTTNNFIDYSYYNGADSFFFQIPGSLAGTRVEYYFAAQDIALPTPKLTTLPAGGSGVFPPGTTAPPTRFTYNITLVGITANGEIPSEFKLYNNFPNPFNPSTKIKFDIPNNSFVKLVIYDIQGRTAAVLVNKEMKAASYEIDFNAENLSSGVYFYKIETSSFTDVKKMLLVK